MSDARKPPDLGGGVDQPEWRSIGSLAARPPVELGGAWKSMVAFQRNLSSVLPKLDEALAPARELVRALGESTAHTSALAAATRAISESQRLWQVSSSLRALVPSNRLPVLPKFAFPGLVEGLAKFDLEALRARDERAVRLAARHNWFFLPETPISFAADVEACGDDAGKLDVLFGNLVSGLLPKVKTRLVSAFPHRAAMLQEVFALTQRVVMSQRCLSLSYQSKVLPSR